MAISVATCGKPGATVSGTSEVEWSYKTKAGAAGDQAGIAVYEYAEMDALTEGLLKVSCDNHTCPKRRGKLTSYSSTSRVERGFLNWLFGFFHGKPWKLIVVSTYTAEVWCGKSRGQLTFDRFVPDGESDDEEG